jgi:hypothetical protein
MPGGVILVQCFPPSRVIYTTPSSDTVQLVDFSMRAGAGVRMLP